MIWDKVFKNGPSKICGRQSLKNFTCSILESLCHITHYPNSGGILVMSPVLLSFIDPI